MKPQSLLACSALLFTSSVDGFAFVHTKRQTTTTALHMGLFDGVKEAFSAPALERSSISSERETPIDRWMGWSVASEANSATRTEADAAAGTLDLLTCSQPTRYECL